MGNRGKEDRGQGLVLLEGWCWWQLLDICDIFSGFPEIELSGWEAFSLRWRVVFGLGGGVAFGVNRLCHTGLFSVFRQ